VSNHWKSRKEEKMSGKYALIIGNTEYIDPGLAQLTAPGKDAEDFARVLRDKEVCAFDTVNILLNQDSSAVIESIDEFFDQKKPEDLLVLYFSGHGVRDEYGSLYLAFKNTIRSRLRSTAVKSEYIREAMDQSRSKRQVVMLDCCNSGAFPQGTKAELGGTMGMVSAFQGYGRFVLTASDATQFAWEGNKVIGETQNSLFTHFLMKGLRGEADSDGDGKITVDELYDYAYEQISRVTPKQTPTKSSSKQEGEIILRQISRMEDIKPLPLPSYLITAIESPDSDVRLGAVQSLTKLLTGKNIGLARSANETLGHMARSDDSRRVSQAATQALKSASIAIQEAKRTDRLPKRELQKQKRQNAAWVTPAITAGSVFFLSLCAILSRPIWSPFVPLFMPEPSMTQTDAATPAIQTEVSIPSTFTSTQSSASTSEPTQTIPPMVMSILPTDTEVPTPTIDSRPDTTCARATKRLRIGIEAQVVTASETLAVRSTPEENVTSVVDIPPGTIVTVLGGPRCGVYESNYYWWWEVKAAGSTGWVVEGKDEIDKVFIRPKARTQIPNEIDGATLIYIPPGRFTLGLTDEQKETLKPLCRGDSDCQELIEQNLGNKDAELTNGYWIYRTEVTNSQYAKCANSGICDEPQSTNNFSWYSNNNYYANPTFSNYPVVLVSWNQAKTYCEEWASGRLPTSAEWEKAASWDEIREEKYIFPWGNSFDGTLLNFCDTNCSVHDWADTSVNDEYTNTSPVESYLSGASPSGVLNMAGNVWEWVNDFYSSTYYLTNTNWTDPKGPDSPDEKNDRVIRGGSAWYLSAYASAGIQDSEDPGNASTFFGVGFRCVIDEQ
jgi:formylglycine-generating enzyme required for sulfatase activity